MGVTSVSGPRALSRTQGWALTIAATLTMTISYVDRQTLAVLAPTVTRALHISESGYGLVAAAFSLAYLVGAPLAGPWIDRVGARRGLVWAVLAWTAVSALHTLVPGFGVLVGLRVALGLAESPSFPGASQAVHRALSPADRPRGLGVLFTGSSIGSMIAPALAVALQQRFGWRVAMLGTAVAGLAWLPVWLLVAWREPARSVLDASHPADPAPDAVTVGEGPHRSASLRPPVVGPVWKDPALQRALVMIVASSPVVGFNLIWPAKFLVRAHAMTQASVASILWIPPLFFDLGAVAFGDLAARLARSPSNPRGGTHPRLMAVACALATVAAAMPFASTPLGSMLLAGVAMFGGGGVYATLTSDMLARVHPSRVSAAGGLCAAAQSLAFVIANPLIGLGVQRTGAYTLVLVVIGAAVVPGAVAWQAWPRVPPVREG